MGQVNRQNHPTMKLEFFKYLPSEIEIDILSRLPVRSVISCKCVQKSWLHLVETRDFVKSHLSKSAPGLITREYPRKVYTFFELEDGVDIERHDLHYKLVNQFKLINAGIVMGSAAGLLFLCNLSISKTIPDALCICNPITRDCININCPQEFSSSHYRVVTYGFGSSKITGQYKLVRISHDRTRNPETREWLKSSEIECHVYTLGTGLWRIKSASCASLAYINICNPSDLRAGVFVNGNLHWLVHDLDSCTRISYFDLETERFSTLSTPPFQSRSLYMLHLFVLGDSLGLSDNTSRDEIVIWSMKEYGVKKLWTKEIVISNVPLLGGESKSYPIKVFKDGDILIRWNGKFPFYYCSKSKTVQKLNMCHLSIDCYTVAFLYTPSFVSLKSFGLKVSSF